MKETITITSGHNILDSQSYIVSEKEDNRWWKRLYCFLLRKPEPTISEYYAIMSIDSETQFTIKKI